MRRPLVVGNWKMNTSGRQAEALAAGIRERVTDARAEVVVCPPFIWLERVRRALEGSPVRLGAQNAFWQSSGAYTGEISPAQVAELCDYVILGHSERRRILGETDEQIARKVRAASEAELNVILAVGEDEEQHDRGEAVAVVGAQLRSALAGEPVRSLAVAYEPVWAIGTGRPATGEYAQEVAVSLREELAGLGYQADSIPILYGGSVTAEAFEPFVSQPDVDGALVGGASLKADEFSRIVEIAASSPQ